MGPSGPLREKFANISKQLVIISPLNARFGIRVSLVALSAMALTRTILLEYNSAD